MKPSQKRIFSILISLLMIIGSLFAYNFLIKPTYLEIRDLRTEIISRLNLIKKNEIYLKQVQKILDEYQNIDNILKTISLVLPPKQDTAFVVNQIAGLATTNELRVESLEIQQLAIKPSSQPSLVKGLGTLRLNVRLRGGYENFKSFLQALETNITLMDLKDLRIEPIQRQSKTDSRDFYYLMTIDSYYQSE